MIKTAIRAHQIQPQRTLKSSDQKTGAGIEIKTEKKFGLKEDHLILCKNCGSIVTAPEHIIAVNGHHTYTFTNPSGITYRIGCFSSAHGCITDGDPTLDHTWFEGFSWNYALCLNCLIHLGWYYQRGDEGFFGLILDNLEDNTRTH